MCVERNCVVSIAGTVQKVNNDISPFTPSAMSESVGRSERVLRNFFLSTRPACPVRRLLALES